jgi:hypothetical protein
MESCGQGLRIHGVRWISPSLGKQGVRWISPSQGEGEKTDTTFRFGG